MNRKTNNRILAEEIAFEIFSHPVTVKLDCEIETLTDIIQTKLNKIEEHV
jgi:hypothetical protein